MTDLPFKSISFIGERNVWDKDARIGVQRAETRVSVRLGSFDSILFVSQKILFFFLYSREHHVILQEYNDIIEELKQDLEMCKVSFLTV